MYPDDRVYSKEHEWVRREGDEVVIGVTFYAQDELGDVVFVELPETGSTFEANEEIGSIESVKAVAELFTPVGGDLVEINEKVTDSPELLNEDPHGEGWLVRIKMSDPSQLDGLMSAEEYRELADKGGE